LRRLLPFLALILLMLLCFHKLAFTDGIIARGDTYVYFYPYWAARDDALRSGHIPLWTPNLFMGAPMLADPQVGVMYPPNWLTVNLNAPNAIRVSILLHTTWIALGMYLLARRRLGVLPALLAAALFAFGGHVGGHVEQINQLQGLAWLPWAFLALDVALENWRHLPLLALVMALQALCGHTQTVFITGVGLGIYGMLNHREAALSTTEGTEKDKVESRKWKVNLTFNFKLLTFNSVSLWLKSFVVSISLLMIAAIGALLLALPQLAPTLELIGLSNRQDGLSPQGATAFSLSPLVVGRALLPNYDTPLFGEYIAYMGVAGIGFALLGVFYAPRRQALAWTVLAIVGLALALGAYNPLYWTLASLPGFNLFRVPARWLALFAFGAALLAGHGLQALLDGKRPNVRVLLVIVGVIVGLVALAFLTPYAPEADDVPGLSAPSLKALLGWGAALAAFVGILMLYHRGTENTEKVGVGGRRAMSLQMPIYVLFALALLEVVLAASTQPYNDLSARDAYEARRFTVSQLQALNADEVTARRVLSISDLLFDPGDRAALEARYSALGMSEFAVRNSFIDIKLNEILSPNQPLRWGIPTIDGFGGGLVPTAYYTWFASLVTPDGQPAVDGRLREALALPSACRGGCIPEQRWLDLMGVRYLIVDKVYDFWQDGVAYDTAFEVRLSPAQTHTPNYPTFEATALDVLYAGETAPVLVINGETFTGEALRPLDATAPSLEGFQLVRFTFAARSGDFGTLEAQGETRIRAITLVDTRVREVFQQVTVDNAWQLALSSDVKVYERLDPLPRAFMVSNVITVTDDDGSVNAALQVMDTPNFDPRTTAVIAADDLPTVSGGMGEATITHYEAEHIEITVNAAQAGYLVLAEAWYPGWRAWVNGLETPVHRADVLFRAVQVPAGASSVVFTFAPTAYPLALWISAAAWGMLALWGLWTARRQAQNRL
jgi:Bacterial membrane protein YfhO